MHDDENRLDPAESIAVLYLSAPLIVFFFGFIRLELAIPACALIALQFYQLIRRTAWQRSVEFLTWRSAYFLLFTVLWISWVHGVGSLSQTGDWYKHYAVLNLLAQFDWPPGIQDDHLGTLSLRYYLGWYLVPALALKLTSTAYSHLALLIWSILGVFLVFTLLPRLVHERRSAILLIPIAFAAFGGADWLGMLWTQKSLSAFPTLEWWAGWAQYSANITAVSWVPQHAISAWLGAVLLMRQQKQDALIPFLGLLMSSILLWSPFSAVGLVPLLCVLTIQHRLRKIAVHWQTIASVVLVAAAPIALFLTSGSSQLPHGFIGSLPCTFRTPCFSPSLYVLFILIEVGAPLVILFLKKDEERAFLIAAAIALCTIPLYKIGLFNDLAMRASLPSLAVLTILVIKRVLEGPKLHAVMLIVVFVAAFPDVYEGMNLPLSSPIDPPSNTLFGEFRQSDDAVWQYFSPRPRWLLSDVE